MLTDEKQVTTTAADAATVRAARPCVFFQEIGTTAADTEGGRGKSGQDNAAAGRCMLRPGRTCGPDGGAVLRTHCTPMRQESCQAQRRQTLAQLVQLRPAGSTPDVVGQAIGF